MVNMTFAAPNITTGITDMFTYANYATHDMFGLMFVVSIFVIFFVGFKGYQSTTAFGGAAIIASLAGALMAVAGFLSPSFVVPLFVVAALSVLLMYFGNKGD